MRAAGRAIQMRYQSLPLAGHKLKATNFGALVFFEKLAKKKKKFPQNVFQNTSAVAGKVLHRFGFILKS